MSTKTAKLTFATGYGLCIRITQIFDFGKNEIIDFDRNEWTGPGTTRNWLKVNGTLVQVVYRDHILSLRDLEANDVVEIGFDQIYHKKEFNKMERQSVCGIVKKINDEDMTVEIYSNVEQATSNRKTIKPKTMIKKFSREKSGKVLWSNFSSSDPKKLIITHRSYQIDQSPEWQTESNELTWLKINGAESLSSKSFESKIDFDEVKVRDVVQIGKDIAAGYYRMLRIDQSEVIGIVKSIKGGEFTLTLYPTLIDALKAASNQGGI